AEARGEPYDVSSLGLIISSGVMWSTETKQALMARGNIICFDSLGSSEGVGFAGSISAPGSDPKTAKFTIRTSTNQVTDDGGAIARCERPRRLVFVPGIRRGPNGKADSGWAKQEAANATD